MRELSGDYINLAQVAIIRTDGLKVSLVSPSGHVLVAHWFNNFSEAKAFVSECIEEIDRINAYRIPNTNENID